MINHSDWVRLKVGEIVQAGDMLRYGETAFVIVRFCKYDPGCCVGHVVECCETERYYRCRTEAEKGK